ncbi:hypothetical protein [uncultured Corynebacterium sp.]|uniref:hypothetical protein n=1 Tax=uncultured Corynebacterium sp. TaxID=159447 RepID=UPI0025E68D45|nr:hypothetical protein [uncultured Corynebacterium sp.]
MKLNKRVLASAAISASFMATAVTPVAWAAGEHLNCVQNFRAGVDAGINANVAEHLRRNCHLSVDQIIRLNVEDMKQVAREFKKDGAPLYSEEELNRLSPSYVIALAKDIDVSPGDTGKGPADGEQQSGPPLSVNDVKAGDREITGSVFLLPGQQKRVQINFPSFRSLTTDVKLEENSVEEGGASNGKAVTFKFDVPEEINLKAGETLLFSLLYDSLAPDDRKSKSIPVVVKSADVAGEERPDSGDSEGEFPFAVTAEVNDIKAGDKKVTGKVRLYPGQEVEIEASFPSGKIQTTVVKLEKKSAQKGQVPEGEFVSFEIDVPADVKLMAGDKVTVSPVPHVTDPKTGESNSVELIVKAADKGSESQPEQAPGNGNGKGKEGGSGSTKPAQPSVPGAEGTPGAGEGSSKFGKVFEGIPGLAALVEGVAKFFNKNSGLARLLQPLRNFFSLFKF